MHQARVVLNEILEPFQGPISLLLPNSSMFSSFIELDFLENLIVGKLQIPKLLIIAYDICKLDPGVFSAVICDDRPAQIYFLKSLWVSDKL